MKKRLSLSYRTNVVKYADNILNKKNFFSIFFDYFVLFFDFSGMDKNSFYSMIVKLRKNRLLGEFVQVRRFLSKSLSFVPSTSGVRFVQSKMNELLLANDVGFVGLLVLDKETTFSKLENIFSFYTFCFSQKFVNPFGKKFMLDLNLGLDFFFKPLFIKLSNFLICPKFFNDFVRIFYKLDGFSSKLLQVKNFVVIPRLLFVFFTFFFRYFFRFERRWLH